MAKRREKQRKRGRPVTTGTGTPVIVRCHEDFLARVDRWVAQQEDKPSRPEAIRRLAELGLGTSGKVLPGKALPTTAFA
jgi:hypothetical protein